jgi:nuclear pore complex protein Nup85
LAAVDFHTNLCSGPATFTQHAADIASSLPELYKQPGTHAIFIHQLVFAEQYAHFHQLLAKAELQNAALELLAMFRGNIAPKSWWAILLCDSVPLLQSGK